MPGTGQGRETLDDGGIRFGVGDDQGAHEASTFAAVRQHQEMQRPVEPGAAADAHHGAVGRERAVERFQGVGRMLVAFDERGRHRAELGGDLSPEEEALIDVAYERAIESLYDNFDTY